MTQNQSTTNLIKNICLFGDICPCEDCDCCSDYTPVDVNGEVDVDLSQNKRMTLKDYIMLYDRVYCDE